MSEPRDEQPVDARTILASLRERTELSQAQSDDASRQLIEIFEKELEQIERSGQPSAATIRFFVEVWDGYLAQRVEGVRMAAEHLAAGVGFIERAPGANELAMVAADQAQALTTAALSLRVIEAAARLRAAVGDA